VFRVGGQNSGGKILILETFLSAHTSSHPCRIYLFRSLAAAVGFGWMLERAVAGGETFSLVCLGFFGSRPLRF
jgi:hypothetical protein